LMPNAARPRRSNASLLLWLICVSVCLHASLRTLHAYAAPFRTLCPPQQYTEPPFNETLSNKLHSLSSEEYRNISLKLFQQAIQIDTQVFDDSGTVESDPRFGRFKAFADYLDASFPILHSKLQLELVNTYARLYTWKGTDESLKPSLLMAHQDVVPATSDSWTHPPFSGHFDGRFVWGRGAVDTKDSLVAILEAVEALAGVGFQPKRTLMISLGIDEELMRNNNEGATKLAARIEEIYGRDSLELILDEGPGVERLAGASGPEFATPALGEKGYMDMKISLRTQGGHSCRSLTLFNCMG
jgi:Gly-Xaa carboxypeptidase